MTLFFSSDRQYQHFLAGGDVRAEKANLHDLDELLAGRVPQSMRPTAADAGCGRKLLRRPAASAPQPSSIAGQIADLRAQLARAAAETPSRLAAELATLRAQLALAAAT